MINKNWLLLSHAFNMDGRAASQTVTDKIPFLLKKNISLQVLSSTAGNKDKNINHKQLVSWSPSGLRFDFRYWLKRKNLNKLTYKTSMLLFSLLLLPFMVLEKILIRLPSHASWAIPACITGFYRVKRGEINLVYSSGGAWSAHLAGYWIHKLTRVKWIVEMHDPMISIYDEKNSSFEIKLLLWLERKILESSTIVWWFSEGAELVAKRRCNINLNNTFNHFAGANPPMPDIKYKRREKLIFSHFGSLTPGRSLKIFLMGIFELIESGQVDENILEIHIYGGELDTTSLGILKKYGLEKIIFPHGRIEAIESESGRSLIMRKMICSDVLVLMHGEDKNCSEYIPSKFYEYLQARRAILAYPYKNSQFTKLLERSNCYISDKSSSSAVLNEIINDWSAKRLKISSKVISTEKIVDEIITKLEACQS